MDEQQLKDFFNEIKTALKGKIGGKEKEGTAKQCRTEDELCKKFIWNVIREVLNRHEWKNNDFRLEGEIINGKRNSVQQKYQLFGKGMCPDFYLKSEELGVMGEVKYISVKNNHNAHVLMDAIGETLSRMLISQKQTKPGLLKFDYGLIIFFDAHEEDHLGKYEKNPEEFAFIEHLWSQYKIYVIII